LDLGVKHMLEQSKRNTNRKRLKNLESVGRQDADFSEIAENSAGISTAGD